MAKKKIPQAIRKIVWERYAFDGNEHKYCIKCPVPWCPNKILALDFETGHKIPESKGGSLEFENLIPICSSCNKSMSNKYTYDQWCNLRVNTSDSDLVNEIVVSDTPISEVVSDTHMPMEHTLNTEYSQPASIIPAPILLPIYYTDEFNDLDRYILQEVIPTDHHIAMLIHKIYDSKYIATVHQDTTEWYKYNSDLSHWIKLKRGDMKREIIKDIVTQLRTIIKNTMTKLYAHMAKAANIDTRDVLMHDAKKLLLIERSLNKSNFAESIEYMLVHKFIGDAPVVIDAYNRFRAERIRKPQTMGEKLECMDEPITTNKIKCIVALWKKEKRLDISWQDVINRLTEEFGEPMNGKEWPTIRVFDSDDDVADWDAYHTEKSSYVPPT